MIETNRLVSVSGSVKQKLFDIAQQAQQDLEAADIMMSLLSSDDGRSLQLSQEQINTISNRIMLPEDGYPFQIRSRHTGTLNIIVVDYFDGDGAESKFTSFGSQNAEGEPYQVSGSTLSDVLIRAHPNLDIEDFLDALADQSVLSELLIDLSVASTAGSFNPGMIYAKYANRGIPAVQQIIDAVAVVASTGDPTTILEAINAGMTAWTQASEMEQDNQVSPDFWRDFETSSWTRGIWKAATAISQGVGVALMTVGGPILKIVGLCVSGLSYMTGKLLDRVYDIPIPTYDHESGDTFYHAMLAVENISIDEYRTIYHPEFAAWFSPEGKAGYAIRSSPNDGYVYDDIRPDIGNSNVTINPYSLVLNQAAWSRLIGTPEEAGRRLREYLTAADCAVWDPALHRAGPMFVWEANGSTKSTWFSSLLNQCVGYWRSYVMLHRFIQSWSFASITPDTAGEFRYPTSSSFILRNRIGDSEAAFSCNVGVIEDALSTLASLTASGAAINASTVIHSHALTAGHLCDFIGMRSAIKNIRKYENVWENQGWDAMEVLSNLPLLYTGLPSSVKDSFTSVPLIDYSWRPFFTPPEFSPKDFIIMRAVQTTVAVTVAALSVAAAVKSRKALTKLRYRRQLLVDKRRAEYLANPTDAEASYRYSKALKRLNAGSVKASSNAGFLNNLIGINEAMPVEWTTDDWSSRIYSSITGLV